MLILTSLSTCIIAAFAAIQAIYAGSKNGGLHFIGVSLISGIIFAIPVITFWAMYVRLP
jgi:hypothetical protein